MKLYLNFDLKDLAGNPIPDANCGKAVATALSQNAEGDALKYWGWATKLYQGEVLDLDASDVQTLKGFITTSKTLTVLLKGQVLLLFK
jgi:hypothetical protein